MSTNKDYKSNFSEILSRLHEVSGLQNEYEIAEILGFKKDTFAARKSRGSIPEKEIKIACVSNGWSFDWVMNGSGEMLVSPEAFPHGIDKFRQAAAQAATISKEKPLPYGVTTVVEGKRITPREERLLEIIRSSPEAASIVEMLGAMDSDTRKDVQLGVQKEKLLRELLKEKAERNVA